MSAVTEVMYGKLSRLTDVYRYSAQSVIRRENVAEHSFWVAMIGVAIAGEVKNDIRLAQEVALRALVHDVEESTTGDLVREMKYFNEETRESISRVEKEFAKRIFEPMGRTGENLLRVWKSAKDMSLVGRIVALADLLCVIAYCDNESRMGNHSLQSIREECEELIYTTFQKRGRLWAIAKEALNA